LYCTSCETRCTFYIRFPFESTAANSETLVKTYTYDGRLGAGNSSNDLSTDSALLTQSTARASSIKTESSRSNGSARSGTSRVAFFVEDEHGYANTLTSEEESSYRNYLDIKQYLLKDLADFRFRMKFMLEGIPIHSATLSTIGKGSPCLTHCLAQCTVHTEGFVVQPMFFIKTTNKARNRTPGRMVA